MTLICELDEQWSFVENKARQQWHWYAYTTKSGGVLAYTFGPRTDETCRELPELLKPFSTGMITRDNRSSYTREMPQDKHLVGKIFTRRIERNNLTLLLTSNDQPGKRFAFHAPWKFTKSHWFIYRKHCTTDWSHYQGLFCCFFTNE